MAELLDQMDREADIPFDDPAPPAPREQAADDIPLEADDIPIEPDDIAEALPTLPAAATPPVVVELTAAALVQVLPSDFQLPLLTQFVPDARLRDAAGVAATYALTVEVAGAEGLARADVALTALRDSQKSITEHFRDPVEIANRLHKQLTGWRADWLAPGQQAIETVGRRIWSERQRLDAEAAAVRRKAQEEADRQAREAAAREAEAAAKAAAPAPVVEEMKRRAETATAPPVPVTTAAPAMRGTTTVTTWKSRIKGTPADAEPNPAMAELTPVQIAQVHELMRAVLDGKTAITAFELNWSVLNGRAKADKSTLAIPGIEAYQEGSVRAKGTRRA